jgi:hypothetical protein
MERAREGVKRVTNIVRAMKDFSHPNTEARSSADINKALETTLEVARSEYKHSAVVDLNLAPLPLLPCNIGELNQVFLNLLVNAVHAIEASGKNLSSGRIGIATQHVGSELIITFADNGCGIKPENLDKIFDPFFTTKEVGKGTGQGLAISRSIVVDRHGGALDVHSIVGTGTRFTIRLPLTPPEIAVCEPGRCSPSSSSRSPTPTPGSGRNADLPLERPVECRLRFVADIGRDLRNARMLRVQQAGRQLHTPLAQVLHRGHAHDLGEALGERGSRKADLASE